jgi:hypothetical protein
VRNRSTETTAAASTTAATAAAPGNTYPRLIAAPS